MVDTRTAQHSAEEIKQAARAWPEGAVRILLIEQGRRQQSRLLDDGLITVDGNALARAQFYDAIGTALGWKSERQPQTLAPQKSRAAPLVRDQARQLGRLILVAEDNHTNQKVIQRQLGLLGFVADIVPDGRAALRRWQEGQQAYALLMTDIHMPEMDGYQLSRAIRAQESQGRRIPIIALSADSRPSERQHCLEAGIDDYLSKPARLDELKSMLEKWRLDSEDPGLTSPQSETRHEMRDDRPPIDIAVLTQLVGNDTEVIHEFLHDFQLLAEELGAEINQAAEQQQQERLRRCAHKFKSSAYAVGAGRLGELCSQMEKDQAGCQDATVLVEFRRELAAVDEYLSSILGGGGS